MHLFILFYDNKFAHFFNKLFIWLRPTSAAVDPESPPIVEEMTVINVYLYGMSQKLPYGFLGKAW